MILRVLVVILALLGIGQRAAAGTFVKKVTISPDPITLRVDETVDLNLTLEKTSWTGDGPSQVGCEVDWKIISGEDRISIKKVGDCLSTSKGGVLTGKEAGSAQINIVYKGGFWSTVKDRESSNKPNVTVSKWPNTITSSAASTYYVNDHLTEDMFSSAQLTGPNRGGDAEHNAKPLTYKINNVPNVTMPYTFPQAGTYTVVVSQEANYKYEGASETFTVTVRKRDNAITWKSPTATLSGTTSTVLVDDPDITADWFAGKSTKALTYSWDGQEIDVPKEPIKLNEAGTHTLTVTNPTDYQYLEASKTYTIQVNKRDNEIRWLNTNLPADNPAVKVDFQVLADWFAGSSREALTYTLDGRPAAVAAGTPLTLATADGQYDPTISNDPFENVLVVTDPGDYKCKSATRTFDFAVGRYPNTLQWAAVNQYMYGDPIPAATYTADVTALAEADVPHITYICDGKPISLADLQAGSHTIQVICDETRVVEACAKIVRNITISKYANAITDAFDKTDYMVDDELTADLATSNTPLTWYVNGAPVELPYKVQAGDTEVRVEAAETERYAACDALVKSITVGKYANAIAWEPDTQGKLVDDVLTANAQAQTRVSYFCQLDGEAIDNVATDHAGNIVLDRAGEWVVTAQAEETYKYVSAAPVVVTVRVDKHALRLTWSPNVTKENLVDDELPLDARLTDGAGDAVSAGDGLGIDYVVNGEPLTDASATLRFDRAGEWTAQATCAGNRYYAAAQSTESFAFSVERRANQFKWVNEPLPRYEIGTTLQAADLTADCQTPVTFTLGDEAMTFPYTFGAAGQFELTPHAAADRKYDAPDLAGLARSVEVYKHDNSIAWQPAEEVKVGGKVALDATSPYGSITYTLDGAPLDGSEYTFRAAGTYTFHLAVPEADEYVGAERDVVVVAGLTKQVLTSTPGELPTELRVGESIAYAFESNLPGAEVTVTVNGKPAAGGYLFDQAGTYNFEARSAGTVEYSEGVKTWTVRVRKTEQRLEWPSALDAALVGQTITLDAHSSAELPMTYSYVDANGVVTPIEGNQFAFPSAGHYTLRCEQKGNTHFATAALERPVTVSQRQQSITLAQALPVSVYVGEEVSVTATAQGGPVVVSVDGEPADASGKVVFASAGQHTVLIEQPGDATFSAAPAITALVQAVKRPQVIEWDQVPLMAHVGESLRVAATATSGLLPAVEVTLNGEPVALDDNTLTFAAQGQYRFTLAQPGDDAYEEAPTLIRLVNVLRTTQKIAWPGYRESLSVGDRLQLDASVADGLELTYTLDGKPLASQESVRFDEAGEHVLSISQPGDEAHEAAPTLERWFVVVQKTQQIEWGGVSYSLRVGEPLSLEASASSGEPVTYYVDGEEYDGAEWTPLTEGTYVLEARQEGNDEYEAAPSVQHIVTVNAVGAPGVAKSATTALGTVSALAEQGPAPIYDLAGRLRGYDLNALPNGIYLQAGRKIIKK